MKKLLFTLAILFAATAKIGATLVLNPGDLVFISYSRSANSYDGFFTILSRVPIPAGTKIVLSNNYFSYPSNVQTFSSTKTVGNTTHTSPGEISITFNEPVSVGQAFQVVFNSAATTSTIGVTTSTGSLNFGSDISYTLVWIYEDDGTAKKAITGLMWNDKIGSDNFTSLHATPPGIKWNELSPSTVNTSGVTALNLLINGNSDKCGSWNPYTANTAGASYRSPITLSSELSSTFYNKTSPNWVFNSSNVINTCSASDVLSKVVSGYLDTYLSFDKYRYGFVASTWEQFNGSTWSTMTNPSSPDWSTTTRTKEVYIYQDLTLGSFSSSSPSSTLFECAKLFIIDEKNDGVTLTIEAGHRLLMHYSVSMTENSPFVGTNVPKIYLKSNKSNANVVYHAQIEPSAAHLSGTYKVEKYIQDPEWHHFISPIKTKLNQVTFTPQNGNSTFAFNYTGSVGNKNVYFWDADNVNEVFWQPVGSTGDDYFSAKPYTIYFASSEVPTIMTVEGPMALKDQDSVKVETVKFKSVSQSTTSPGQGAPSWTTAQLAGWNFYGNPYLSYISTNQLMSNFSGSGNSMSGLAGSVYVWDPNYGGINHSSNYIVNTGTENNGSLYIEPFQAFFMYTTGGTGNSNGFVKSKKYRVTSPSVATVTNKTLTSTEVCFEFLTDSNSHPMRVYLHPSQVGAQIQKDEYKDAVFSGSDDALFFVISDSSRYAIKHIPKNFTSITIPLSAHTTKTGGAHCIRGGAYIDEAFVYFLKDLKTGGIHNLNTPYWFTNDPTFSGNRFELTILPNKSFGTTEVVPMQAWISTQDVPVFHSTNNTSIETCFDINGRILASKRISSDQPIDCLNSMPTGVYFFGLSNGDVIKFFKQ
jgi:hypothetical protein